MTRNDIRVQFNKEKDLHVLQTEGTGYIHYTDDYVHWLEDIALMQANGVEQSTSNCNITLVGSSSLFADVDELMRVADDKGWCFYQGMWRKDGWRSRTTYDLYAHLFL